MPIIVSIENRERNSVVVELVSFEFANHVVQAVGNTLCTSQSFLADIVVIVVELLNLILKFLFILFSLSQFFFYFLVLSSQSIEMLFGEESALSNEFLVSRGNTKVEQVAKSSQHIGVVETNAFLPESRSIGNDIALNFEEEGAALANSVAETKTSVELNTGIVHTTGIVVAKSKTTTGEYIQVATAFRIPVVEGVVQRKDKLACNSTVSIHCYCGVRDTPVGFSFLVLMKSLIALSEPCGMVIAETDIGSTVDFFLKNDTGTSIESTAPERFLYAIEEFHIGLIVEGDSRTYAPIAPESVLRILRNLVLGKGTACKNQHAEQYREF